MKRFPDHAGRLPDHPRYGNPSDPDEEADRIGKAYENVDAWQRKYGAEFSGSVKMQYGDGPVYNVPIGKPEIADRINSRPIVAPAPVKALPEPAEAAPEPPPIVLTPSEPWFVRLINRIKGVFR